MSAALATGCGFRLAQGDLAQTEIAQGLYFDGATPAFRNQLSRRFRAADTPLATSRQAAQRIIVLEGPVERLQVLAVTEQSNARDYELSLHLTVHTQAADGSPEQVMLSRYRHWHFDENQYLASDEERRVLTTELHEELIDALLRWLGRTQAKN